MRLAHLILLVSIFLISGAAQAAGNLNHLITSDTFRVTLQTHCSVYKQVDGASVQVGFPARAYSFRPKRLADDFATIVQFLQRDEDECSQIKGIRSVSISYFCNQFIPVDYNAWENFTYASEGGELYFLNYEQDCYLKVSDPRPWGESSSPITVYQGSVLGSELTQEMADTRRNGGFSAVRKYFQCEPGYRWTPVFFNSSGSPARWGCRLGVEVEKNLGKCDVKSGRTLIGHPVNPATGNKYLFQEDIQPIDSRKMGFSRSYNSGTKEKESVFGWPGWVHNYQRRLDFYNNSNAVVATRQDGRKVTFVGSAWVFQRYQDLNLTAALNEGGSIAGWNILSEDGELEVYSPDGRLLSLVKNTGYRQDISYGILPNGAQNLLHPTRVLDVFGRSLIFEYIDDPYFSRMILKSVMGDPGSVKFNALSNPRLFSAIYADEGVKKYKYNTMATSTWLYLVGVVDELDVLYSSYTYAGHISTDRVNAVTSTLAGNVDSYSFDYSSNTQTKVTDPLMSVRTMNFEVANGSIRHSSTDQPAGSGCAASTSAAGYDAGGVLNRQDDFNKHRTCFANQTNRGLESERVEGLNLTVACSTVTGSGATLPTGSRKTSTAWHPDWTIKTKQAEPLKLTTWVYNGQPDPFDGNQIANCVTPSYGATTVPKLPDGKDIAVLCKQVEQPTLDANGSQGLSAAINTAQLSSTLKYTYTQYGQVLTSVDARGNTTNYAYYCQDGQYCSGTNKHEFTGTAPNEVGHYQGDLWKVTNAKAHVTEYTQYDRAGRPLSMLDPNGLVTTYAYWPRGWIKSVTVGSQATSYDYWPTGLLKKVTQPDSSYLAYTYDDAHRLTDVADI